MQNKYAVVDSSLSPIIKVVFTGEKANETNFPLYLYEVKQVYKANDKIAIIFDATEAVMPGLKFQKMQGDWLKENEQLMKDYCVGTAYLIPNLLIRNVLKAIFAFQKQPIPYLVCSTMKEAQDWVNAKL